MVSPIDYRLDVQSPFQQALQGYQAGTAIRDDIAQQQAAQQQALAQQQMQSDLDAASKDHRLLPGVMVKYPQLAEKLKHGWDAMSGEQQRGNLSHMTEVYSAVKSGRPEIAIQLLNDRAAAMRSSGDEAGAKRVEDMARWAEMDPESFSASTATRIAALPGGDKVIEGVAKLGDEGRKADLHGPAVDTAKAGARKAGADATTAETTAQYADQNAVADLQKKAADLGLTKAQTNQAMALTRKYDADTRAAIVQAATGDPSKRFDAERNLRKEFVTGTAGANETRQAYERIKASKDDAVGDLSLIFGYMKMLDPGSVVREGEFATAQNAAGVPERVVNLYNRLMKGERLSPAQRASFLNQAKDLNAVAERRIAEVRKGLDPVIKSYGLDSRNVYGEEPAAAPAPAPAAPPGQPARISTEADYAALPSGATFVAPDGTTRRKP